MNSLYKLAIYVGTIVSAYGAQVFTQKSVVHTADDLLIVTAQHNASSPSAAKVQYALTDTPTEDDWTEARVVMEKQSIQAMLPLGAKRYRFSLTDGEQHYRYPANTQKSFAIPVNLKKKTRTPVTRLTPDTKWIYKTVGEQELYMDVFYPEGYEESTVPYPVFLVFHGGSWQVGETNWHYADCAYWASRGMVAASVDYRLGKRDGISEVPLECMKDAQSAVRYVRSMAAALKLDPKRVVVAGGSAGGQLAASLSTYISPETAHPDDDQSVSPVPDVAVLYNPYFKCKFDPAQSINTEIPPTISFLGDQDSAISVAEILSFHNRLKAAGVDSEYYVGKSGKHGLCNGRNPRNPFFYWSLDKIDHFLVKHKMITGDPTYTIPAGVTPLTENDYTTYD